MILISKEKLFSIWKYTISSFLFLIVSYLLLAISFAVTEKKELFKRIEGIKLIVSNLESYKKNNGGYPESCTIAELFNELNIKNDIIKVYLPDFSEIYYDTNTGNDDKAILMWRSENKISFFPESWMQKYHYEITYSKKDGLLSKREWD